MRFLLTGPIACFRRPELKRDLVTYPICPPHSAASALRTAWPGARVSVKSIAVLRPIRRRGQHGVLDGGRRVLVLEDVAYLLDADASGIDEGGQEWRDVHLGLINLAGKVRVVGAGEQLPSTLPPAEQTMQIGLLLYDLEGKPSRPRFFDAELRSGICHVPNEAEAVLYG